MSEAIERYGKRTWKQDPEGRRAKILEAAQREFAANGMQKTRLDAVARQAGVSEGTVYHLFGSKRGLLEAVGAEYGERLAAAAFSDVPFEYSPRQTDRIVRNIFEFVRNTEGAFATFLLANDPAEGGPAEDANRGMMLTAIEAYLDGWVAQTGAPLNTRIIAQFQFNLVEGALRDCYLRGNQVDEEAYIREAVRMLAASLRMPSFDQLMAEE